MMYINDRVQFIAEPIANRRSIGWFGLEDDPNPIWGELDFSVTGRTGTIYRINHRNPDVVAVWVQYEGREVVVLAYRHEIKPDHEGME